jgi:hypothetical protein
MPVDDSVLQAGTWETSGDTVMSFLTEDGILAATTTDSSLTFEEVEFGFEASSLVTTFAGAGPELVDTEWTIERFGILLIFRADGTYRWSQEQSVTDGRWEADSDNIKIFELTSGPYSIEDDMLTVIDPWRESATTFSRR